MAYLSAMIFLLSSSAWAQSAGGGQAPNMLMQALPFIAMFAIFYFFMIRPQVKKQKEQQVFLSQLKRGDEVLTSAGILGTIEGLTDRFVTLKVADGVNIRVLRTQVHSEAAEVRKEGKE